MRADQLIVARGLAPSRQRARALIEAGAVRLAHAGGSEVVLRKPSVDLPPDATLLIDASARPRFVSRGGTKLEAALRETGIDASGRLCLDLGQSTGGFTDCLLQHGAVRVVGVDVGHGQLHPDLRSDARVLVFEGVNVRALDTIASERVPDRFDLIVADLSFISLAHALGPAARLLSPTGDLLALVKPQFEVGPGRVGARGVVRDATLFEGVRTRIEGAARAVGLQPIAWLDSALRGGDGNREFFLHARP